MHGILNGSVVLCSCFFYVRVMLCAWHFERECGAVCMVFFFWFFWYVRVMLCAWHFERECGAVFMFFLCEGDVVCMAF